jgi:uncharacterized membrane protein
MMPEPRTAHASESAVGIAVWSFIALYVATFSLVCSLKFRAYAYGDFDLAHHDQMLWNILHGSIHCSILGVDFLGNHAHLISFLVAPLYAVFPSPLTLLVLQTLALGLAAWPLYLLARDILGAKGAAVVAAIYLLYPGLGYTNLFEYHPTVLATSFLAWMLYYFHKERFALFLSFAALALLCQENVALAVIMTGVYAILVRRPFRWIFWPLFIGCAYLITVVLIVIPHFNKGTIQFISIYAPLGNSYLEIAWNLLQHPWLALRSMLLRYKLVYLAQVFLPLAFVPFLSPAALLIALPFFVQHLLSTRSTEATIYYHYLAELLPLIFFAFIMGIRNISKIPLCRSHRRLVFVLLLAMAVTCDVYFGPPPKIAMHISDLRRDGLDRTKDALVKAIPEQASVVATFEFLSHLSHRQDLYSFHHVYRGYYTLSARPYHLPEGVAYALLDFNDSLTFRGFYAPENYGNLQRFLAEGAWGVMGVYDTIVLLEKKKGDLSPLYSVLSRPPAPNGREASVVHRDFELTSYQVGEPVDRFLPMTFTWHSLQKTALDVVVFFDFIDQEGRLAERLVRPICYRIYPTYAWKSGEWIEEQRSLYVPSSLKPGRYSLVMGFVTFDMQMGFFVNPQDLLGRIFLKEVTVT